ncbi:MAG: hypothetical protein LIQ31_08930 [Planctomycetes bacterium]|nr:hypothetical protein [Planctomycetota bacterium]
MSPFINFIQIAAKIISLILYLLVVYWISVRIYLCRRKLYRKKRQDAAAQARGLSDQRKEEIMENRKKIALEELSKRIIVEQDE